MAKGKYEYWMTQESLHKLKESNKYSEISDALKGCLKIGPPLGQRQNGIGLSWEKMKHDNFSRVWKDL